MRFSEKVIPDIVKWTELSKGISALIDTLDITAEQRSRARNNIGRFNQIPRAAITDELLKHLEIELGEDEKKAWRSRHNAAHGNPMNPTEVREIIRDTHLMRIVFHRMILRIVNGSEAYYDYASPPAGKFFPVLSLGKPSPSRSA